MGRLSIPSDTLDELEQRRRRQLGVIDQPDGPYPASMPGAGMMNALNSGRSMVPSILQDSGVPAQFANQFATMPTGRESSPSSPAMSPGDFAAQAGRYTGPALPDYPALSPQAEQPRVMITPSANPVMTPAPAPVDDGDERASMIRDQLMGRMGGQMAAAGPMGMMAGQMAQRKPAAAAPATISAPAPVAAPQALPPANGLLGDLGANPHLSTIVTGSGTRTMAFPQGPNGTFGRGQDLGMTPWEGPQNPADQFRSSFLKNLYGTGAPSSFLPANLAAQMAEREMQNRTVQQEGDLGRQNLLERERLEQQGRVEAAGLAHKHGMNQAQYSGAVNAFLSGQGPQFAQADAFARGLGGQAVGGFGGAGAPAGPANAAAMLPAGMSPPPDTDVMGKVNRLMMQEASGLPKTLSYEIPGIGMGANRKPAMSIIGGAEGKVTPEIANKLLGRFSAEGFGENEFKALNDVLGRSAGGQEVRKALLAQLATDELAFRPPPSQGKSGFHFMPAIGLGGRTNVYPETMQYSDVYPGMKLQAQPAETWLGQGLKTLRDRMYAGGLPYRQANIGGENIPIDPGASMATLSNIFGGDEAMKRAIESRRAVYPALYKALAGAGAVQR